MHRYLAIVAMGALLVPSANRADPPPTAHEYAVKAACLYWFANFTTWPASALPETNSPLIIGVLGADPFGALLERTLQGKSAQNHPIQLRRWTRASEITTCQLLFISASEQAALPDILPALRGRGILTVSEVPRFLEQGGMINFIWDNPNIAFEVNLMVSKPEQFEFDSRMLREARLVIMPDGERRVMRK